MRRTTLHTAFLLGAALLTPTGLASAVGETCRGEAATVVGTGNLVQGTEGRDVIVTSTATSISSYGGNDLICITGSPAPSNVTVNAGPGDDASTAVRTPGPVS